MNNRRNIQHLRFRCACINAHLTPHQAVLPRTTWSMTKAGPVLGFDGKCKTGTLLERTILYTEEEVTNDKTGEVRIIETEVMMERGARG